MVTVWSALRIFLRHSSLSFSSFFRSLFIKPRKRFHNFLLKDETYCALIARLYVKASSMEVKDALKVILKKATPSYKFHGEPRLKRKIELIYFKPSSRFKHPPEIDFILLLLLLS